MQKSLGHRFSPSTGREKTPRTSAVGEEELPCGIRRIPTCRLAGPAAPKLGEHVENLWRFGFAAPRISAAPATIVVFDKAHIGRTGPTVPPSRSEAGGSCRGNRAADPGSRRSSP
jgi:hypothetical protein